MMLPDWAVLNAAIDWLAHGLLNLSWWQVVLYTLVTTHITIAAVVTGLVLGIAYGWAGAQSLLGSVPVPPSEQSPTLVWPAVPFWPVVAIAAATAVLTLIAAVVPTRLATRVAPVEALAE